VVVRGAREFPDEVPSKAERGGGSEPSLQMLNGLVMRWKYWKPVSRAGGAEAARLTDRRTARFGPTDVNLSERLADMAFLRFSLRLRRRSLGEGLRDCMGIRGGGDRERLVLLDFGLVRLADGREG